MLLSLLVFLYPVESADFINSVPVKFVLLLLCWLLATATAVVVFFIFYIPEPRRLAANTWRLLAGIGIVSSGASVLGFPRLMGGDLVMRGDLNPEDFSASFKVEWQEAANAATATVAVSLFLLVVMALIYLATDSIIIPMVLHAMLDMYGGAVAYIVLRKEPKEMIADNA